MTAYYNEIDAYAAQWLRNLIAEGHIPAGDVDERSIADVQADDLRGYTQCHFFAGLGGWGYALRLAGWPDDKPVWTGSCPCQPFSVAGKQKGFADDRHLWPVWFNLIRECRPAVVFGEQVASAKLWLDGVCTDMEAEGYAIGAAVLPACAVNAPHKRDRLWFVADAAYQLQHGRWNAGPGRRREPSDCGVLGDTNNNKRLEVRPREPSDVRAECATTERAGARDVAHPDISRQGEGQEQRSGQLGWPSGDPQTCSIVGADGKARRVEPGVRLLAHGVPARVAKLRALGNAIVPQVAAEFIRAYLEVNLLA